MAKKRNSRCTDAVEMIHLRFLYRPMAAATIWSECRIDILLEAAPAADEDECFWDESFDMLTLEELFEGRWIAVLMLGLGGF